MPPTSKAATAANRLGEMLLKSGRVTSDQLQRALAMQKDEGGRLGTNLVKLGYLTDDQLVDFLSQHFGVPSISLDGLKVDEAVIKIIPADVARKYTILPISRAPRSPSR
jgi:type IV pilus assembly protein PilB